MIVKYNKVVTAVSGSISFNTNDLRGVCYRVFIKPATSTTTYDITFTDDNTLIIYSKKGVRGTLNDISTQTLKGIHTVAVTNASVDEQFTFQIEYQEDV
mgnify:CR=1 FL=1